MLWAMNFAKDWTDRTESNKKHVKTTKASMPISSAQWLRFKGMLGGLHGELALSLNTCPIRKDCSQYPPSVTTLLMQTLPTS